ncbi:probable outer membrane phospholipase A [Psychrobacter arcticus 273-4]|uniref:Phospholipase A1 n=1 Tax=Psychrobacter arcticus (strain DSM 17307 / VKM B-2377 / 273-4) TaxID=259536 RepID=Q4FV56_PSYA2|nr:phospholipase A [Psychrobacter arcticus]AAZ18102.1 probable outer membrane phospholipase A [Psychrobacter arcticus 273-4]
MFSNITSQRPSLSHSKAPKKMTLQTNKCSLHIAVGVALTCFTVQAQAADTAQTYNELPQTKSSQPISTNIAVQNGSLLSEEFVAQQAALFFECTQVQTSSARLACFDKVAEQGKTPSYVTSKQPVDLAKTVISTLSGNPQIILAEETSTITANGNVIAKKVSSNYPQDIETKPPAETERLDTVGLTQKEAEVLESVGVTQADIEKYTPLSLAYDLDKNSERGTWNIRPHNPNYVLPLFYTADPNLSPNTPSQDQEQANFTSNNVRQAELKFQLSLKSKVAEDLFDTNADLWFGYTQQSHWQVYNEDNSRPFRATDYQPEVFLTQPVTANLPFGGRLRMLGVGAVHHSNGRSEPLSRSWNRIYLMGGAEWGKFSIVPRVWARVDGGSSNDDNPDIEDFMSYGDIKFLYDLPNQQSLSGTLRYHPGTNKGSAQIDYVYPLTKSVNGYVQLFQGYGESLIDYNYENTAVGVGIVLNDWKGF